MEIKIPLGQISLETDHADKKRNLDLWVVLDQFQVNTQRKNWKVFIQCIEITSDSIKVENILHN